MSGGPLWSGAVLQRRRRRSPGWSPSGSEAGWSPPGRKKEEEEEWEEKFVRVFKSTLQVFGKEVRSRLFWRHFFICFPIIRAILQ